MKLLAVFLGLAASVAAVPMDTITGDSMIPIDPALAERFTLNEINLEYGEVDYSRIPGKQQFDPIATRLAAILEGLRDDFETGTDTIPPLDPFRLAEVGPLHIRQIGIITGTLNAQDLQVLGLKQFIIANLSFSFIGLTLRFELVVPRIDFRAQYQLDSRVAIFIPYNPRGDARIRVDNARAYGFASLGQTADGFLTLNGFQLNLGFDNFVAVIEGVIGGTFINATFNLLLNLLGPNFLQEQTERISELVTETIHDTVNEFIGQFRLVDLLG